jgi:dTDP-4-amino-4,6-dideoxygalactose transaminase
MYALLTGSSAREKPPLREIQVPDIQPSAVGRFLRKFPNLITGQEVEMQRTRRPPILMNTFYLSLLDHALDYIGDINRRRRENGKVYQESLPESSAIIVPRKGDFDFLRFPVLGAREQVARELCRHLQAAGYEAGNFNWPFTLNRLIPVAGNFPDSGHMAKCMVNLPSHPTVTEADIISLCEVVRRTL